MQCIDAPVSVCTAVFKQHSVQNKGGLIVRQFYVNTFFLA